MGDLMIIQYNSKERELLARIMRAEAVGEGNLGMLMVGNVVVNRVLADCLTFKNVTTLSDVIYQENQFSGTSSPLFFSNPTTKELELTDRILKGEYYYPATNALWFYAPSSGASCKNVWYDQQLAGKYKSHCFYNPDSGVCKELH
jgi:N-acetylmuramoyl-L-alanine amidase